jgi:hypothetical protein
MVVSACEEGVQLSRNGLHGKRDSDKISRIRWLLLTSPLLLQPPAMRSRERRARERRARERREKR